ncbi:DUF397 domain-containing protein [Streptomyces acidicola]|uniref:DUF397 domain-containing protein n=1 Tax=Streptomyces acidicola TaxID=2596892 RepID=UPI002AD592A3|nr:DUF397 domain-containing protein [Streptomyces acidicola]
MWQKSSFSGDDASRDCVEVAAATGGESLLLRESDVPGTTLRISAPSLRALLGAARSGALGGAAADVSQRPA